MYLMNKYSFEYLIYILIGIIRVSKYTNHFHLFDYKSIDYYVAWLGLNIGYVLSQSSSISREETSLHPAPAFVSYIGSY